VTSSFNLHGRALLTIEGGNAAYHRYFENEYRRAARASAERPSLSVTVRLVDRLPAATAGDRVRRVRFKRLFTFRFLVRGFASRDVTIFFERHPVDRVYALAAGVFLQAHVLEPILYAKWLEEDAVLLHAAGIVLPTGVALFPAHGGTGKTTLALRLARRGFALLGDDLVFVDVRRGIAYPHPRPLHLFSYNLQQMREVRLPWTLRAVIGFKDAIRPVLETLLRTEFLITTRAHVDRILPELRWATQPADVRQMVFLSTTLEPTTYDTSDDAAAEAVAALVAEAADLNRSLRAYVLEDGEQEDFSRREHAAVRRLVALVRSVPVVNPRAMTPDAMDRLLGLEPA